MESKIITSYKLGTLNNTASGGIRLYMGSTHRLADARDESGGLDYTTAPTSKWARDVTFDSRNAAVFVENIFRLSDKIVIVPGIRYEWLEGAATGRNKFRADSTEELLQNITRSRSFLLAGIGAEYHVMKNTEVYANYTQAYRPIQFANLQAPPTTNSVDPDLKDAKGYNIDLGFRGKVRNMLQFDISAYYLQYNNRIGNVPQGAVSLVTNVGNSTSKGVETYVEFNPVRAFSHNTSFDLILFSSYSYVDARYTKDNEKVAAPVKGQKVENAPANIFRGGISAGFKNFLITGQVSHAGETYSDATNTVTPTANWQSGLIPSYTVADLTASYKFSKGLNIKAGINNLFDARYFTRRSGGYPGPGVLPADGRTVFLSVGAKF